MARGVSDMSTSTLAARLRLHGRGDHTTVLDGLEVSVDVALSDMRSNDALWRSSATVQMRPSG
jgi:hypothetical protein